MLHIPPDIALFLRPPIGTCVSYNYFYFCIINNLAFVMKTQSFFEVVYEYCLFFRSKITKIFLETTSGPLYVCLSVTWYQSINIFSNFREIRYKSSLQRVVDQMWCRENSVSDSHVLLTGVNKFLSTFFIFLDRLLWNSLWKTPRN